jgi:hypothetical protein
MKKIAILFVIFPAIIHAQNSPTRSSAVSLDFSKKKSVNSSFPKVTWVYPENETTFLKDGKVRLQARVESKNPLKGVSLVIRDKDSKEVKASTSVPISEDSDLFLKVDKNITLTEGINQIELVAENKDGLKTSEFREVHVGTTALADASKLGRKDYALIFATDQYDNWKQLVNPIYDARTIAGSLEKTYGFKTDLVENPTREQVFLKLREYAEKKFNPLDQLFIFFAGHGFYDDVLREGFVVPREALPDDPGRTSYIRHSELRSSINNNPCEHIFLVMDVCFGGTFDESVASRGDVDGAYAEASQSEMIVRKLQFRTRKYLTSGGKEYVSDGIKGSHSPFAKQFIDALESTGGNDGMLTLNELMTYIEKLKTAPQFGKFGADQQGSEFVFVVK